MLRIVDQHEEWGKAESEQIRAFLEGSQETGFEAASAGELYEWTKRFLCD